jgi:Icc-related predicted phosphoesterase
MKTLLLNAVGEYVCAWNDNEDNNEKIHDFFLLGKDETERRVTVFVDFGSCDPVALIKLATHLSAKIEKNENIERISFE